MAYRLPTFNLVCNISNPNDADPSQPPVPPFRIEGQVCQLTYGRRVQVASTGGTGEVGVLVLTMNLLLPALTDIRGPQDLFGYDVVEVPAESGRWYRVFGVDDIGKNFANEHRTASIYALPGTWAHPYP